MGSFDILCSVTGSTIRSGDRMVRILIAPLYCRDRVAFSNHAFDSRNHFKEKATLVSNEGCQAMFVPYGFGIRGEYDDCSYITDIKRDRNVEKLEEHFGMKIEVLLNQVANDDRWDEYGIVRYNEAVKKRDAGEHYDGYDITGSNSWALFGPGIEPKQYKLCKKITFMDIHEEVYNYLIKPPNLTCSFRKKYYQEAIDGYFKDVEKKKQRQKQIDEMACDTEEEKRQKIYELTLAGFQDDFHSFRNSLLPRDATFSFLKDLNIDETWRDEYIEMLNFIYNMNELMKIITPTFYGSQDHNYYELLKLTNLTKSLLEKKIKEWEKYIGDDDLEEDDDAEVKSE